MRRLGEVLAGLVLASGCAPPGTETSTETSTETTLVFAAASLAESFEALAGAYRERYPGAEVELHFAGTPQLVFQLREGSPADVFASADEANMQRVVAGERGVGAPVVFARNRLALVVARGNPEGITGLGDWARDDLTLALCGPDVPAGRYARRALARAGLAPRSVSDEPSVRALVSKVELGELDAGIVYATDTRAAAARVSEVRLEDEFNVSAAYPIVALRGSGTPSGGARFVEFVLSADGQHVLRSFGFEAPR